MRLLFQGAELPGARPRMSPPVSRDPRRSSQQVGRGARPGPKRRRNQSFRARRCLRRRGTGGGGEGRRRQRMTATPRQLADSSVPAASRRRGPHPERTPPRPAGSGESSPRDGDTAQGAREEGCAQARDPAPSAAGTGPKGHGDTDASRGRRTLGTHPPPHTHPNQHPFPQTQGGGGKARKVCRVEWEGEGSGRGDFSPAHAVPAPTRRIWPR